MDQILLNILSLTHEVVEVAEVAVSEATSIGEDLDAVSDVRTETLTHTTFTDWSANAKFSSMNLL